ncbi:gamma-glutamylcyclotransferase family protein [uncultured Caulobacter sp.]|jgi:Gamma-glutamyl cyclotransferase, AIG2-like|uniref:gamma-glutamylcyclotransferase family protein n=1 Tax=uncultured Caulobacter sp. TaxID=158749 RepID=UPI002616375B|nr:gamma-glutamylcyclotransferase family protein [uncultured Caulobacter sp.]
MSVVRLFSYGTLQQPKVQRETFGRLLEGRPDALPGFRQTLLRITDPAVLATSGEAFHPIVTPTGDPADRIEGAVFEITPEELAAADAYEVSDYKRIAVRLASGLEAFVYVQA